MSKLVKVMYKDTSGAQSDFVYKINEVNISGNWNPKAKSAKDFGGFNYCDEKCILRWLHRGDTIYDVEVPKDAENIKLDGATIIYRTNKIIVKNPRKIDDDLAMYFYKISEIPEKSYYKALAAVTVMNYENTARTILKDKVSKENIEIVLEEWNDFIDYSRKNNKKELQGLAKEIDDELNKIKDDKAK